MDHSRANRKAFTDRLLSIRSIRNGWLIPTVMALVWLGMWVRYFATTHYFTLATTVQDDAYYYLLPAWNHARLGWFTFDGVTQTYGFQPLWELVLVVLARMTPTREVFFRGALMLGAGLYAATSLMIARVARAVWRTVSPDGGNIAASAAAAMMLLNLPVSTANCVAKENALYGFILSCLLMLRLRHPSGAATGAPLAGVLAGCVLLTRITPMSAAVVFLQRLPERASRRTFIQKYGLALVMTLLPWSLYAYWTFGSALPMSGRAKLYRFWPDLLSGQAGVAGSLLAISDYMAACVRFALGYSSRFWPDQMVNQNLHRIPFVVLTVAGFGWALRARRVYLLLLTAGVLVALATLPVLLHVRADELYYCRWYVVELPILAAVFAGVGTQAIVFRLRQAWAPLRLAAVVTFAAVILPTVFGAHGVGRPITDYVDRGEWQQVVLRLALTSTREFSPERGERIGAFSAGLLGWLSPVPVVNLDGLANDEILALWNEHGTYQEYCRRRGITLYVDAVPPSEWFKDVTVVRTVPMPDNPAYPNYYIARLPSPESHYTGRHLK